jgi:hypothetical protein
MKTPLRVAFALTLLLTAATAEAQFGPSFTGGATPRVPVSPLARPAAWLDPSRLHITSELMVGTGFGGASSGLQVTRLQYQLGQPLALRVSVGNAFGGANTRDNAFFLEGLDLSYQPFSSMTFQVHYQDVRSPLQYGSGGFYPYWR